jgi:periplasmic protein TonB
MSRYSEYLRTTLFENRNKDYGAYAIRLAYASNMTRGMFFSMGFIVMFVMGSFYYGQMKSEEVVNDEGKVVILDPIPDIEKAKVIPPKPQEIKPKPVAAAPILQKQTAFVEVKVVTDTKPIEEADVPTITDLSKSIISNKTVEGQETGSGNAIGTDDPKSAGTVVEAPPTPPIVETPRTFASRMPAFPDGEKALYAFLKNNLNYPVIARENNIQGTVVLQFVVSASGKIDQVKIMKGIGGGCDEEAKRVVLKMPDWTPGNHNNKAVAVRMTVPIKFTLN